MEIPTEAVVIADVVNTKTRTIWTVARDIVLLKEGACFSPPPPNPTYIPLAQVAERLTSNQEVAGSSSAGDVAFLPPWANFHSTTLSHSLLTTQSFPTIQSRPRGVSAWRNGDVLNGSWQNSSRDPGATI